MSTLKMTPQAISRIRLNNLKSEQNRHSQEDNSDLVDPLLPQETLNEPPIKRCPATGISLGSFATVVQLATTDSAKSLHARYFH